MHNIKYERKTRGKGFGKELIDIFFVKEGVIFYETLSYGTVNSKSEQLAEITMKAGIAY